MELEKLKFQDVESFIEKLDILNKLIITELSKGIRPLNGERFLTNEQLYDLLHISKRTLQEYRDTGILNYIKLPGKILYKESDIRKLLEKNYHTNNGY
ncbi:MAG: helix-turn-helix domain-containing protein [Rikenellaceae bacterium]|nr:helix-turn-helix domain-containing protein [Rikenellaceae bacterium]